MGNHQQQHDQELDTQQLKRNVVKLGIYGVVYSQQNNPFELLNPCVFRQNVYLTQLCFGPLGCVILVDSGVLLSLWLGLTMEYIVQNLLQINKSPEYWSTHVSMSCFTHQNFAFMRRCSHLFRQKNMAMS